LALSGNFEKEIHMRTIFEHGASIETIQLPSANSLVRQNTAFCEMYDWMKIFAMAKIDIPCFFGS
jgi:hypothetical protein